MPEWRCSALYQRKKSWQKALASSIELMKYPKSLVALARILNRLGMSWTFRSDGYEATNFGMLSGNAAWQKDSTMKLINAAVAAGAKSGRGPTA